MITPVVVLHSGGQDSTTCLAWAVKTFGKDQVYTVGFDYNQRHLVELECAQRIHHLLELPHEHKILELKVLSDLAGAALTNKDINVEAEASAESGNQFAHAHGLPSTFVPGRNMLFFTTALAYGAQLGIYDLVTGVCETDRSGYPDCRTEFVVAAQDALSCALDEQVTIHAPLLTRSKASTWAMAEDLGVLELIREETMTCYHGVRGILYEWGYGCSQCPACIERQKGYEEFMGRVGTPS